MLGRSDLALERISTAEFPEVLKNTEEIGDNILSHIKITTDEQSKALNRPKGNYITLEIPSLITHGGYFDETEAILAKQLRKIFPKKRESTLVVGLGNTEITPDALGPLTAQHTLATRHIGADLAKQISLNGLKSVSVLSPGVLGQTGIEAAEIILGAAEKIGPDLVIVIDALCAAAISRLGSTVQITDTGICPGSGVGNHRREITEKTLGVPVIAMGVPTVVEASTLIHDLSKTDIISENELSKMVVTPKDIDILTERASCLLGNAINIALQPEIDPEILRALV